MQKYLVKVTLPEAIAAKRIADSVRSIGSHFATHAAWRRKAGVCTGMMVVEAADRWGALGIVPPGMRGDTHVFDAVRPEAGASPGRPPSQRPMSELGHEPTSVVAVRASRMWQPGITLTPGFR